MEKDEHQDITFVMSFLRTGDALNRYLELELAKWQSSPIRFAVMNALLANGGEMTPKEISRRTYRAPRTITSMIDSLERDGLVRREANPADRRSIRIVVTAKGWAGTRKMVPRADSMSKAALSVLSPDEIATLDVMLRKWRKHLFREIESLETRRQQRNR